MKFLLVNLNWANLASPKTFKFHFALPPLDLLILRNIAISNGHEARILDGTVDSLNSADKQTAWADFVLVTTTPYHMWQCPNVEWEVIRNQISIFPREKTILLGLHGTVFPEQTLRETGAYALIRKEPERSFQEYLKIKDWFNVASVSYLNNGVYYENPNAALSNLQECIVNEYSLDISKYTYFLLGKKAGIFESSRGCPWKCTFCDQEMFSWKYRTKEPESFAEEVLRGVNQTGMQHAYFYDLEFTIQGKRTLEVCDQLIKRNIQKKIKWCCQTRADMVNDENLEALKAAGCKLIHFGVESAVPAVLKATNKKITLEKILHGVKLAKKHGFQTACFFMFGLPGENENDFLTTLEFARDLNPTYASFHFAVPFPGTPLYKQYLEEKNLKWGIWPATYFNKWSHAEIRRFLSRAYCKYYLFPKKIEPREFIYRMGNLGPKFQYFASIVK